MINSHSSTKLYRNENDEINEMIMSKINDSPPFATLDCCLLGSLLIHVIHNQQNKALRKRLDLCSEHALDICPV